jgi:hypothetical protein
MPVYRREILDEKVLVAVRIKVEVDRDTGGWQLVCAIYGQSGGSRVEAGLKYCIVNIPRFTIEVSKNVSLGYDGLGLWVGLRSGEHR